MTDVRLSVALMHHPKRRADLAPLLYALGNFPVTVVSDVYSDGPWATARAAWNAVRAGATHHLVLQDDVTPVDHLIAGLIRAVTAVPDQPISIYNARGMAVEAASRGDRWFLLDGGTYGQGSLLPVWMIRDWLHWDAYNVDPECPHDDTRLSLYLMSKGIPVWMTVPALIEHTGAERSLMGHRGSKRHATYFDSAFRPDRVDWTPPAKPLHDRIALSNYWGAKYLKGDR